MYRLAYGVMIVVMLAGCSGYSYHKPYDPSKSEFYFDHARRQMIANFDR